MCTKQLFRQVQVSQSTCAIECICTQNALIISSIYYSHLEVGGGVILSLFYIVDKEDKVSSRLTTNQGFLIHVCTAERYGELEIDDKSRFPHPCVYSREIYTHEDECLS